MSEEKTLIDFVNEAKSQISEVDVSDIDQIYTVHTHIVKHIIQRLPAYSAIMTAYTVVIRMVT